jgi:hypothetical protein
MSFRCPPELLAGASRRALPRLTRHARPHAPIFYEPAPSIAAALGWRAVTLDGGELTDTIQVRLDEQDDFGAAAWTARDILRAALARQLAEVARSGDVMASRSASHLSSALVSLQRRPGLPPAPTITLAPGPTSSAYFWTAASLPGAGSILLCPGPCGGEGVSPELLLQVLDQLLTDAVHGIRADRHLRAAARQVGAALQQEILRVQARCGLDRSL